eukprot:scaffold25275_cov28-Prasinocladus_malaysianus.AAC.1
MAPAWALRVCGGCQVGRRNPLVADSRPADGGFGRYHVRVPVPVMNGPYPYPYMFLISSFRTSGWKSLS